MKFLLFTLAALALTPGVEGCTRVLYTAPDNTVITGRSLDWDDDMHSNLWVFPRGMQRDGAAGRIPLSGRQNTAA